MLPVLGSRIHIGKMLRDKGLRRAISRALPFLGNLPTPPLGAIAITLVPVFGHS
jgi:hypothetical protein